MTTPIPLPADTKIIDQFLASNPDIERVELLFPDMNGIFRGKWIPPESASKLTEGTVRLPVSTYALDIWGRDVEAAGLAKVTGDPDGIGIPIVETLSRIPWSTTPAAQCLMTLQTEPGEPCIYDPRQRLADVVSRFARMGLTPVVAAELEFYFVQPREKADSPPEPPFGNSDAQLYDLDRMSEVEPLLKQIRDACDELDVPADTIIAEFGPGQFEINLNHVGDAVQAADDAILFKRIVLGCAEQHGYEATFMAKPYGEQPGSGMHVHVSLIDREGNNVFSADEGMAAFLEHAVAGCVTAMHDCQAIFAPHANSYRRFQPGAFAPIAANWGYDNRNAGIRVPATEGPGARLEHRVSGSDVNPYLAIAAVLGSILIGLEDQLDLPPAAEGDETLPEDALDGYWNNAVSRFARSSYVERIFGAEYQRVYSACRRTEIATLAQMVTNVEFETYLNRI